jgi:hypothetical protein
MKDEYRRTSAKGRAPDAVFDGPPAVAHHNRVDGQNLSHVTGVYRLDPHGWVFARPSSREVPRHRLRFKLSERQAQTPPESEVETDPFVTINQRQA